MITCICACAHKCLSKPFIFLIGGLHFSDRMPHVAGLMLRLQPSMVGYFLA
jgi:hypothetical protein